jgi:hypothetical protein
LRPEEAGCRVPVTPGKTALTDILADPARPLRRWL